MPGINKYASIVYRISQTYFDEQLRAYHIGSGQQFFLLKIYDHPGISQQELAKREYYDKGTTARAVKKLEVEGYITRKVNVQDNRVIRLFITKKGEALVPIIQQVVQEWRSVITQGLNEEEASLIEKGMKYIADNARMFAKTNRKKVGKYGNDTKQNKD